MKTVIRFILILIGTLVYSAIALVVNAEEEIVLSAAASLATVMTELGEAYESQNPAVDLVFNYAASGSLLQQIRHGAPVDVYLSANQQFMDRAEKDGLIIVSTRKNFATNRLVLIQSSASPLSFKGIRSLQTPAFDRLALGNPTTVPAGIYAKKALVEMGLWQALMDRYIYANSVRHALQYVIRQEVDLGIVYQTDAVASGGAVTLLMTLEKAGPIVYPVAVIKNTANQHQAMGFIRFLLSDKGRQILTRHGFNR